MGIIGTLFIWILLQKLIQKQLLRYKTANKIITWIIYKKKKVYIWQTYVNSYLPQVCTFLLYF